MKNLNLYVLVLIVVGLFSFVSCEDIVQADEDADNKKDTTANEAGDMKSSESIPIPDSEHVKTLTIETSLNSTSDSDASGDIKFEQQLGQVEMIAHLEGLNPGPHAIHLHEKADCSSADGKSAGGHWNPTNEEHGKWGDAEGYHKGDIGNFEVADDGTATVRFETSEWCIDCDDSNKDIMGHAVVIHQGKDDFISQPSGDAGKRVGCAEISDYQEK